jgi:hypothetical protein
VKLTGTTSRLVIGNLDGEAALDLSGLRADHLEFRGTINGNAQITLNAPASRVEFFNSVNGNPTITINAPAGLVEFHRIVEGSATIAVEAPEGRVHFRTGDSGGALVTGGAQMRIVAKLVNFGAGLDGGAQAEVILSPGGELHHGRLAGGSALSCRKADPSDPDPVVTGDNGGSGRLIALPE